MTVLLRLLPFLLAAAAGGFAWHSLDNARYEALQATFAKYREQVADDQLTASQTAQHALQDEQDQRYALEMHNGRIMQDLNDQLAATAADRDFARRLLAAAQARSPSGSAGMSTAADRPGTDDTSGAPSDGSLTEELGAAASEARACFERLSALQAELRPQLR